MGIAARDDIEGKGKNGHNVNTLPNGSCEEITDPDGSDLHTASL